MESLGIDELLPEMVLAEIASFLSPIDFATFRQCSKRCLRACQRRTNRIRSFSLETAKYTNGRIEFRGNEEETTYYVTGQREVRLPKEYADKREATTRIMDIEKGVEHFFNRFTLRRPEHITISVVSKYVGNAICEAVFAAIENLYNRGVRIRCWKLTCSVDNVERCQLLTRMFQCAEYEVHGAVGRSERAMQIDQLSQYVRDCPKRVYIDQFCVDVRQITAKDLHVWQTTLTLDEFVHFCRTQTKKKNGIIMHLIVTHEEPADLDQIISQERQRLNPYGTSYEDYTTYTSRLKCTYEEDNKFVSDVQFRWYML